MAATDYNVVAQQLYVSYFGRPADYYGLQQFSEQLLTLGAPTTIEGVAALVQAQPNGGVAQLVSGFNGSPEAVALYGTGTSILEITRFVNAIYNNVFHRDADPEASFWINAIVSGELSKSNAAIAITQAALSAGGADATVVLNTAAVAANFTAALDTIPEIIAYAGDAAASVGRDLLKAVTDTTVVADYQVNIDRAIVGLTTPTPVVRTLTIGADNLLGTSGNDNFIAGDTNGNAVWTTGDVLDGGAGNDTLTVTSSDPISIPTAAVVRNIETVNLISGDTVGTGGTALNTTGFTGLTALNTTSTGGANIAAAATTNVVATNTTGAVAIAGGLAQTVTTNDGITLTGAAGAINATTSAQGTDAVSVNGGTTVAVTANGQTSGTITVGNTAAATGAVTVTAAGAYSAGTVTLGAINVTGGTTVSVTQTPGFTAAQIAAARTDATNLTNNNKVVQSEVNVTGTTATTAVTVSQASAVTAVNSTGTNGVLGVENGKVTVTDANFGSTTAAGTIATVSLNGFAATSSVNSSALTTLNLSGTGAGSLNVLKGSLTAATPANFALNLNGFSGAGINFTNDTTTLNVRSSGTASTVSALNAGSTVTTLNVSGDAKLTVANQSLANNANIVVTNTAGVTLSTALAVGQGFTGGAGDDSIALTTNFTKAITLGAGNDTVTYAVQGTGGSVDAGAGTLDKLIITDVQAALADNDAVFNSKFTGFEVLELSSVDNSTAATLNLQGLNNISNVRVADGGLVNFENLASGGSLTLAATGVTTVVGVSGAAFNATDVLNIGLSSTTALTGSVTAAGVETINISTADAATAGSAAVVHAATLAATSATSIVVTGNNGLNLTNTGNAAVTNFNASGVVGNGTADTAANLAVTFTSVNGATAVTITGGAGNDVLTAGNSAHTINGGAGNDTIVGGSAADTLNGGEGADTITGGAGNDSINLTEVVAARDIVVLSASNNGVDTITGFATGAAATADAVQLANANTTLVTVGATAATFGNSTNTTLTNGFAAFDLTGVANTNAVDVVEINATLSSFGNLSLGTAGVVDGTELLKGLSSVNVAASGITVNNNSDAFYVVAYQGGNAYLYQAVDTSADSLITAGEISLVGVFNNVAAGSFVANNFTVGA